VVCSEDHRFLVAEQLRQLGKDHSTILLEPLSRNTAPDFALAVLSSQQDAADLILLVLPGDHVIINTPAFHRAITQGVELVRQDMLVVFGIVPGDQKRVMGILRKAKSSMTKRQIMQRKSSKMTRITRWDMRYMHGV
jgi:mannose-1-phosphate guanylyltransferase